MEFQYVSIIKHYSTFNHQIPASKVSIFSCVQWVAYLDYAQWVAYLEYARFALMGSYICSQVSIVFERSMAIVFLSTYEYRAHAWIIALGFTLEAVAIVVCYMLLSYSKSKFADSLHLNLDVIGLLPFVIMGLLTNIACYLVGVLSSISMNTLAFKFFIGIGKVNNFLYKNAFRNNDMYTLSQKYQLSENIRTSLMLKRIAFSLFILNLLTQGVSDRSSYVCSCSNLVADLQRIPDRETLPAIIKYCV